MLLASLAGMTCLMRRNIGEIQPATGGPEFASRFIDEGLSVVRAIGRQPSSAFVAATRSALTARGSALTASM